ncbi:hypothetical protein D3C77_408180 [compost metagenome]
MGGQAHRLRELRPFERAEHGQGGGQGVGAHGRGVEDGDLGQAVVHRPPGLAVDRMRIEPLVVHEGAAPVARGRHGQIDQGGDRARRGRAGRGLDLDPPGLGVRLDAAPQKLAADLDQMRGGAHRGQAGGDAVHGMALGDARKVQPHAADLHRRLGLAVQPQPPPSRNRQGGLDLGVGRQGQQRRTRPRRAETPQVDQGAQGRIDRAVDLVGQVQRRGQQRPQVVRQPPRPGRGGVEAADLAVGPPRAEDGDDLRQLGLDRGLEVVLRRAGRRDQPHRPGRAHALARQRPDQVAGRPLGRAGQGRDQDAVVLTALDRRPEAERRRRGAGGPGAQGRTSSTPFHEAFEPGWPSTPGVRTEAPSQ